VSCLQLIRIVKTVPMLLEELSLRANNYCQASGH
jgi:hypothetical protein